MSAPTTTRADHLVLVAVDGAGIRTWRLNYGHAVGNRWRGHCSACGWIGSDVDGGSRNEIAADGIGRHHAEVTHGGTWGVVSDGD